MTSVNSTSATLGTASAPAASQAGFAALGHGDFLRLLVEQLKQQDPFDPVDNKEMLAQMAQFSALAGATEGNATLQGISDRLDQLIAAQKAAAPGVAA
jgi:flagellar basal-body rod modification protein FlgD